MPHRHDLKSALNEAAKVKEPNARPNAFLRRPSVADRAKGMDYSGAAMARYVGDLETRMIVHLRKHALRWHQQETQKILRRWQVPQAKPPAPRWAQPIDRQAEARDYAAELLRERVRSRMHKIVDIRIARALGGYRQVDPLHLIFHDRSTVFKQRNRQKL